jgi:hypothetical protein
MTLAWTRIEISTRETDLEPGLQARIADPLWMLARQWQLGELRGEDAGSPVTTTLTVQSTPLRGWMRAADKPGPADAKKLQKIDGATPLEALVECESVTTGPSAFRLAAEAGQHLLRLLEAKQLGGYRATLRGAFPLAASGLTGPDAARASGLTGPDAARASGPTGLDAATTRRIRLLERAALNGADLRAKLRAQDEALLAKTLKVAPADQGAFVEALTAWKTWYDARLVDGDPAASPWRGDRMEYTFHAVAPGIEASGGQAAAAETNVVLEADGYADGHLDWEDFDVIPNATLGLKADSTTTTASSLPTRVRFRGMPARRFWEIEDARIYFGGIEAGPLDLAKLVIAEFATVYSDDWFVIPVSLPTGALHRVKSLVVTDTFGGTTSIPAAAVKDGAKRVWRFFELEADPGPAKGLAPWLLLPPALGEVVDGEALERVVLARDEQANLAWAVEEVIEDPLGRGASRRDRAQRAADAIKAANAAGDASTASTGTAAVAKTSPSAVAASPDRDRWEYRLEQDPPPWWVPLVPVQLKGRPGQYVLRRGRLASWDTLSPLLEAGPRGVLLEPQHALRLLEEEVPAEGVEVTRSWNLARGADGRVLMWCGRRKRPARKMHGSGLRFDQIRRGGE